MIFFKQGIQSINVKFIYIVLLLFLRNVYLPLNFYSFFKCQFALFFLNSPEMYDLIKWATVFSSFVAPIKEHISASLCRFYSCKQTIFIQFSLELLHLRGSRFIHSGHPEDLSSWFMCLITCQVFEGWHFAQAFLHSKYFCGDWTITR